MTIHRARLFHSQAGAQSYHDWLDQWLTNMEPWTDDEVTNEVPTLREQLDGDDEYYQGELAFDWSEDREHILGDLDEYAAAYCDWHRIAYHECTHDDDGGPCSWDEVRENGTVPDAIPTISVS